MSADIVQAQYEQLEQIAARFAAAAETQQALLQRVNQRVDVLRQGGWQGKGVAAFLREMDGEVGPAVGRLIGALQQASQTTSHIVGRMREADAAASLPFRALGDEDRIVARILPVDLIDYGSDSPPPIGGTPASGINSKITKSIEDTVRLLDDLLKPIDWISTIPGASKKFDGMLEDIGRLLNELGDTRGYIKTMDEFGSFLRNTVEGIGFLSNILDAKDMRRYFNGEITNAEIARIAIDVLIPIPGVNDKVADWATGIMVDPDGHWKGLAPQVE